MNKLFLLLSFCLILHSTFALDYTIGFTGSGASTSIDSVLVQNITQGTSIVLPAGNTLNLTDINSGVKSPDVINDVIRIIRGETGNNTLQFDAETPGDYIISIYNTEGRKVTGISENLPVGQNSFELSFPQGIFIINILGQGKSYSVKCSNQVSAKNYVEIRYSGSSKASRNNVQKIITSNSIKTMNYTYGDLLIFKGFSGDYSTLVSNVPTSSKTINFEFVECKDGSGQHYTVVKIGSQLWMAENLKTMKYNDGSEIPHVPGAWSGITSAWCNYNNEVSKGEIYGRLYNWYAVNTGKLAPEGWHVPTDAEWNTLSDYLGGDSIAGGKMKSTIGWGISSVSATNSSGFSALPGGFRYNDGFNDLAGSAGLWWSSTPDDNDNEAAWGTGLVWNYSFLHRNLEAKNSGLSVRCIKNDDTFIDPRDGNVYNTVTIGSQTWMVENLKTTKYNDGSTIPNVSDNAAWVSLTSGAYCWYNNDESTYKNKYGALYNGYAVNTGKLAPKGWRVASYYDWNVLIEYVDNQIFNSMCGAKALAAKTDWKTYSGYYVCYPGDDLSTNNSSGFTALPGGFRNYKGEFNHAGECGYWYSSTTINAINLCRYLSYDFTSLPVFSNSGNDAYSVRCIKDVISITTSSVTDISKTTATCGGNITADGGSSITSRGVVWSTAQNPTIENNTGKTTDGFGTGVFTSNLTGLTPNTTYYAKAYAVNATEIQYGDQIAFTTLSESGTHTLDDYLGEFSIQCKIGDDVDFSTFSPVLISSFTDEDGIWLYIEGLYMGKPWHIAYGKWDENEQCIRLQGGYYNGKKTFYFTDEPDVSYYSVFCPVSYDESVNWFYWLYGGDVNMGEAKLVVNSNGSITFQGVDPDKNNRIANAFVYRYNIAETRENKGYFSVCSNITLLPAYSSSEVKQNKVLKDNMKRRSIIKNANVELNSANPIITPIQRVDVSYK